MKIAIFGSGGVGGYFGGRLAAAGEDVSFLARGAHLTAMQQDGLHITSPLGDVHLPKVQATDRPQAIGPVDVVLFTVKLYDVDTSAASLAPLIGPDTVVITLQNGVEAMDMVAKHVGAEHVAGGAAYIVVVIDKPGHLRHTVAQQLVFGERDGRRSDRLVARNFSLTRGPNDPDQNRPEVPHTDVGRLVGRVVERTPRGMVGVPGAVVHLRQEGQPGLTKIVTRQSVAGGTSKLVQDQLGGFQIQLPAGEWHAAVTADGFETLSDPRPIMIEPDQTSEREFVLVREQPQLAGEQGIRGQITLLDREGQTVR